TIGSVYPSFFFASRRRHTRSYGDWSSDVCSSDLAVGRRRRARRAALRAERRGPRGVTGGERALLTAGQIAPLEGNALAAVPRKRSEERRVGKEGRARWTGWVGEREGHSVA